MPYVTLSAQIRKLHNPQRSDAFLKLLKDSVRTGAVKATTLPGRFELPKTFRRHSSNETYTRTARNMVIDATPAFEAWFESTNRDLTPTRTGGKIKVSAKNIEAGLLDFQALAANTRRKLNADFSKGQALGRGRNKPVPPPTPAGKTTTKRK